MASIETNEGLNIIKQTRKYLYYLETHLENVKQAFQELSEKCSDMPWVYDDYTWHTLRREIDLHDLSKFSKEEFTQYREYFFPTLEEEREAAHMGVPSTIMFQNNFDEAWEHHKKHNTHHSETARTMIDLVHMVIDWTAMGYAFGDTAQEFYEKNKEKIFLSKDSEIFIYKIFDRLNLEKNKCQPHQVN